MYTNPSKSLVILQNTSAAPYLADLISSAGAEFYKHPDVAKKTNIKTLRCIQYESNLQFILFINIKEIIKTFIKEILL